MAKEFIIICGLFLGCILEATCAGVRVCVIGAGISGLTSAKFLKDEGINFTVLEATNYIGGTWHYEEKIGTDEFGQPIYTSMYKHLRTNLPKPTMQLRDFPMAADVPHYPSGHVFNEYLNSYTDHFSLKKYIKFLHRVSLVKRVRNVWKVTYEHVPTKKVFEEEYDYVIVASGHHSKAHMPNIPGESIFKGTIIHSHDYREPEPYKCRRVLIVGSGPSGMDIALDIAAISKSLLHSHHSKAVGHTPYPPHYIMKPDIKEFNETGVTFVDGSYEEIDDVIYCTGFEYNYPFLDDSCGLSLSPHSITPLYKYLININQPTMIVTGAIVRVCVVIALEVQSKYAVALIKGDFTLPSREEMMDEWQKRYNLRCSNGQPLSRIHLLAEKEDEYYADLSSEAGIYRVPPVMYKIRVVDTQAKLDNLHTYRNYGYDIIDDNNFVRKLVSNASPNITGCLSTT